MLRPPPSEGGDVFNYPETSRSRGVRGEVDLISAASASPREISILPYFEVSISSSTGVMASAQRS